MNNDSEKILCELVDLIEEINVHEIARQIEIGDLELWCTDMRSGLRVRIKKLLKEIGNDSQISKLRVARI